VGKRWSATGTIRKRTPGSVGVYLTAKANSYDQGDLRSPMERLVAYASENRDYPAGRISYKLNLRGPSMMVQTASSASLVAVHLGVRKPLQGQCDLAIAGGASMSFPQAGYFHD